MESENLTPSEVLDKIQRTKRIDKSDVAVLENKVNENWQVTLNEAEVLFRVNQILKDADDECPEWVEFFVDCVSRVLVMDMNTPGEIDESEGDWLADMFKNYSAGNSAQEKLVHTIQAMASKINGQIGQQIKPL